MDMSIQEFLQHLANGTSLGSLYALIAIGYTLVYGILRLINFAHGDIFMLGAYIAYYGIIYTPLPWWLVFILASVVTGLVGLVLERLAYKPLRGSPRITILISAIGLPSSYKILEYLFLEADQRHFLLLNL
jgi:branched-chain amino acid transport system permease protein